MNLDIDGTIVKTTQKGLKEENNACKEHLYEHFNLPGHSGFLNDVSVTAIDKIDS